MSVAYAAEAKGLPQFYATHLTSEVFWTVISFLFLLFIIQRFVLPVIRRVLEQRINKIEGELSEAQSIRQESEAVLKEYHSRLDGLQADAQKILREARRDAARFHEEEVEKIDTELKQKRLLFRSDLTYAKEQALKEIRRVSVEIAMNATENIIGKKIQESDMKKEVENAIQELGKHKH